MLDVSVCACIRAQLCIQFQLGEHHVRMPIMVTMTGQNTNQSVKIVQSTSSNHLKVNKSRRILARRPINAGIE
jgi:hypothetical protein